MASEAHKKWGGHSQYGNKKWGGSATSLAIELTLFLANSGAAMAASAAAAPTPMVYYPELTKTPGKVRAAAGNFSEKMEEQFNSIQFNSIQFI